MPGFLLPPLGVVCVGLLLAFLLLGAGASPVQESSGQAPEAGLSPVFTREVRAWSADILRWSAEAGVDPNLAAAVMQIESCGDPRALSSAGAMGLFQVMPYHFAPGDSPYDPDTNARRGLAYLVRSLQAASGDPRLALAGYNGGIGVIQRPQAEWREQTQRYAYWGSGIYADAAGGATTSPRLEEWLERAGRSLCRQAAGRLGLEP